MFGIDFASVDHNTVDWPAVQRGRKAFAIVRACYGMDPDTDFASFWPAIRQAGLIRGAYLFCRPVLDDPIQEVEHFLDIVGPLGPGDLPPTLDLEPHKQDPFDPPRVIAHMQRASALIKERIGIPPMIYTSHRVWAEVLGNPSGTGLSECPLWAVEWRPSHFDDPHLPDEWGPGNYWIQQYAGDTKNIPGITGPPNGGQADLDRFNLLYHGEKGPRAAWLNGVLGVPSGDVFDDETFGALKKFQQDNGLQIDGIVGPVTWSQLIWRRGA